MILKLHFLLLFIGLITPGVGFSQNYTVPMSYVGPGTGSGSVVLDDKSFQLDWSLGETMIGAGQLAERTITVGMQQPFGSGGVGLATTESTSIQVYPNPAEFSLIIENVPQGRHQFILTDSAGNPVLTQTCEDSKDTLVLTKLPPGMYYLSIVNGTRQVEIFPVVITQN